MPGSRSDRLPDAWSDKDKRVYEHVKRTYLDRGRSEDDAAEIAARTVNDHRREEGRTASRVSRRRGDGRIANRAWRAPFSRTLRVRGRGV